MENEKTVDNELVTALLAEKKEAKETAVEMENIIDTLEKDNNQLKQEKPQLQKNLEEATAEAEKQSKGIEEVNSKLEEMMLVFEKDKKQKAELVSEL